MAKRAGGQSLVVTLQIIFSCHNAVLLQRMAYNQARDLSSETRTVPAWLSHNLLWGRGAIPLRHLSTSIPRPWRTSNALTHVTTEGHATSVDVQSYLLPTGGFGRDLTLLNQHGTAQALIEPPIPGDD